MSALNVTSDLFSDQAAPKSQSYGHSVVTPYLSEKSSVEMPEGLSIFLQVALYPASQNPGHSRGTGPPMSMMVVATGADQALHMDGEGIGRKVEKTRKRGVLGGVVFRHSGRGDNMSKSCDRRQHS